MYIDTSAFVKLYVSEPDSEACESVVAGQTLVSSRLLSCEFRSALLNKESRAVISRETRDETWLRFQQDLAREMVVLVPLDDRIVAEAQEIMDSLFPDVPLRTLDALHLSTYVGIESGPFFSNDQRILRAARMLGLNLAN